MLEIVRGTAEHWPQVKDMLNYVWEDDYVPEAWLEWAEHPERGLNPVALLDGRVVGTCHLSFLDDKQVWFQALRIHRDFQGRGIAGALNRFSCKTLKEMGFERALAAIDADNINSQKATSRSGFQHLYDYQALGRSEWPHMADDPLPLWHNAPLTLEEVSAYLEVMRPQLVYPHDLVMLSWQLNLPTPELLLPELSFEETNLFYRWQQDGETAWAAFIDFDDEDIGLVMSPVCSDPAVWPQALRSLEKTITQKGRTFIFWMTEDDPLFAATKEAGFEVMSEHGYQIWELRFEQVDADGNCLKR